MPEDRGTPVERGAAVFNNWCSACHSRDARNAPGTTSLQFKYQGKTPAALEDRRDLTPQAIRLFVRRGVATMPFSRPTEVSDADLDALIAYLTQPKP
jgi:mono/diheme cytochrome c family protein